MSSKNNFNFTSFLKKGKRFAKVCYLFYNKFMLSEMDVFKLSSIKRVFRSSSSFTSCGIMSPSNHVPEHIVKPYYCTEGVRCPDGLQRKSIEDIKTMKSTCRLARKMLQAAKNLIAVGISLVGVSTDELDKYIHNLIIKHSAYPSPLMYRGFPKSICTSVNNIACHGIPDDRKLQNGDIITVDITVFRDGFHGDCAATFLVGNVEEDTRKLVSTTEGALYKAINNCGPGRPLSVIADTITREANSHNYIVLPSICGHGIGRDFHEYPEIMHSSFYLEDENTVMLPGMTFTIEPALSEYDEDLCILNDGWSLATPSGSLCAQFEHTVLITETGVEILTQ